LLRFLDISRSHVPLAWVGGVLGMGIALSVGLFLATRGWEQREHQERMAAITHEQIEKLHVSILRSMEVLHSVAALHRVGGQIERVQFQQFVQGALARQPELQAISWNPVVAAERRAEFETAAQSDGLAKFAFRQQSASGTLIPANPRNEYVPVYLIEPLVGNADALGYDLNSDECRRRSLEEARDGGQPVATAPIRLAQVPAEKAGFLVLLPVYRGNEPTPTSTTARRERLDGFAVAVFKVADLVGESFRELRSKGIIASLFDTSFDGELIYGEAAQEQHSRAWLDVAGRRWAIAFWKAPEFVSAQGRWQSWIVFASGLVFTLLSTAYLFGGWRRNEEITLANATLREEVKIRQRAEAAAAAANEAKSDFLASMSHEIRTPLNAILGYAQLMRRDSQLSNEQRDSIHGIFTGGHHLLGLINEILDLSKIEAGRMELNPVHFDLEVLGRSLATTIKPLCAQKRIGFRFQIDQAAPRCVCGDEGKLRQVLINLLGNAVKFTNAGEVFLGFKPGRNGRWLFEVIDTGLGIPAEEQPDIFKPFHQGGGAQHQGGTGLGLAIAQRQVELLGGRLELQSERGIGSRFCFSIPLDQTSRAPGEISLQVERLAPGQFVRALVVDDCAGNRDVLGRMLANIGCEVSFAVDGHEALRLVSEWQPQIVFLDLLLPGLRGTEIACQLLSGSSDHQPKIVMHSASALPEHREESLAAGCVEFLSKPIECEKLYECLRTHLGVKFQYAEAESIQVDSVLPELAHVNLREGLCARLAVAAELHSTTALKSALQELRGLGPDERQLAEHIRLLMRSYNMNEIQRLLARIIVPVSATSSATSSHGVPSSARSS
jgi:signal transduction histidine kinase/CheY-like chemotaxis protein